LNLFSHIIINIPCLIYKDPFHYMYSKQDNVGKHECTADESPRQVWEKKCWFLKCRRGRDKSMKCDIEKTWERWCDLAGSLMVGGILRWCNTFLFLIFLFPYYPLPLFSPAGCSSPACPTVFAMNTFRESPYLWNMMDEDCKKEKEKKLYIHS